MAGSQAGFFGAPGVSSGASLVHANCRGKIPHPQELVVSIQESLMPLTAQSKSEIIAKFQHAQSDTGSPEVQIALLSARIEGLSKHFAAHTHDHHSRHGLLKMVSQRRKQLDYLKQKDELRYKEIIGALGLRR
jgi:small subunit ribosomal protein S15